MTAPAAREDLRRVSIERLLLTLRLATAALELLSTSGEVLLSDLKAIKGTCDDLEVATLAFLTAGGLSWTRLADEMEVTRQSLHYRRARDVRALVENLRNSGRTTALVREWDYLVGLLSNRVRELEATGLREASTTLETRVLQGTQSEGLRDRS
jgi:hypothetical protein